MGDRHRGVSTNRYIGFDACWSICATPAGTIGTPARLSATGPEWISVATRDTVAGALRRVNRWSLDEPQRRLDAEDWWFRAIFEAPTNIETIGRSLRFGGLAGDCTVWLNGTALLASDNMHVAHDADVPMLIDGENELLMHFASLDAQLAQRRPRPRWRAPMIAHRQLRWHRVSLLGRTPGWSPPVPAIGPWRAIEWIDRSRLSVSKLRLRSEIRGDAGHVDVSVELTPFDCTDSIETVTLRVSRNGTVCESTTKRAHLDAAHSATLKIPNVARWWPHTHGEPALYAAELVIEFAQITDPVIVNLGQLGFRTLTVDTADGDFALHLNGIAVFCRGANWTPLDVVSPAAPPDATRAALAQLQAAGVNMLRINGCMVYEDDDFFDACDELGMLVWQDFMFANMDYPADDEAFLTSVDEEARQQLARWQAHPCMAVICGNSESEQQAAMSGAPREAWSQPLFEKRLAALAQEWCPDVPYWPSSAHGGAFPHQTNVGTTAYYGVGAYLRPIEDARRSGLRFASECLAFSNVPAPATIARMVGGASVRTHHPAWKSRVPRDLGAGWDFEDVRDHYLERLYGVDPVALRSTDHERYLQVSRAVSAEVIEATISEWRRPASGCHGAIVWLLRDFWAGAGWGLLDEKGTPKAAFHGLRRASAPIHLFLTDEGTNGLALHVVNDPAAPLHARVEITLYRGDGLRLQSSDREIAVSAHGGQSWGVGDWFDSFIDVSRAYRFGPLEHALIAATLRDKNGRTLKTAFFFPEGLPSVRHRDIGLQIPRLERCRGGDLFVSIATQNMAQSVYFDVEGYVPQDEYFHIAPGGTADVRLCPDGHSAKIAPRVSVMALNSWSGATHEIAR